MDFADIPFNVPVIIQSVRQKKNLQNPVGTRMARCLVDNRDVLEQMILHRQLNDKVTIQSKRNGRFLQVRANGDCEFDSHEMNERALFTLETDSTCSIFFVSSFMGNVLHCNNENVARCGNTLRKYWEEWRIVEPRATSPTTPVEQ
ncbi:hypothetical protein PF005_g28183 [Phytophthora fragariae]|uniref:Uncharacterized protein n=1 Tax=Phytophthora fragariae TaxID=53985 RepID=A0A6A3DL96_9STRA|nr:hypothetical protein PF003_g3121 [Phytophthora fragariae]KAE8920986.1 hypothetical protein PF009_g28727 [Phytophthora fragariae]KAE8968452.1 hypothetical protein PF011_g27176 [Phytophthora fragariae]KAE9066767.1 hypothetical protein PF010_g27734 [Phytophthora fragariae]KAE9067256.1 hypothetical protein PF007_g28144 [Phytophthora fragariae]